MGEHLTLDAAIARREALRWAGETLVFTNGHFDLLHVGHVDYLEKARALGNALYIGLNGDASTTQLKGEGRPITPAVDRARLLAALACVTAVVIFNDDTATPLLRALQPDIYVKGGDYGTMDGEQVVLSKPLPEQAAVEQYGGRIVLIDYLPGYSTTQIIAKIKALPS